MPFNQSIGYLGMAVQHCVRTYLGPLYLSSQAILPKANVTAEFYSLLLPLYVQFEPINDKILGQTCHVVNFLLIIKKGTKCKMTGFDDAPPAKESSLTHLNSLYRVGSISVVI